METLEFGIATAQQTNRGLATVRAVLGYAGKPLTTLIDGRMQTIHGWQGLTWRRFRGLGLRSLANCDIPDLALFPKLFPTLRTIRFRAGLELPPLQLGLWLLTWLVRAGIVPNLRATAPMLLRAARLFDGFGTNDSGFYMEMRGRTHAGAMQQLVFDLTARAGDGLMIPCIPAIVLTLRLARDEIAVRGARACIGLVDLDAILDELKSLRITWQVNRAAAGILARFSPEAGERDFVEFLLAQPLEPAMLGEKPIGGRDLVTLHFGIRFGEFRPRLDDLLLGLLDRSRQLGAAIDHGHGVTAIGVIRLMRVARDLLLESLLSVEALPLGTQLLGEVLEFRDFAPPLVELPAMQLDQRVERAHDISRGAASKSASAA